MKIQGNRNNSHLCSLVIASKRLNFLTSKKVDILKFGYVKSIISIIIRSVYYDNILQLVSYFIWGPETRILKCILNLQEKLISSFLQLYFSRLLQLLNSNEELTSELWFIIVLEVFKYKVYRGYFILEGQQSKFCYMFSI